MIKDRLLNLSPSYSFPQINGAAPSAASAAPSGGSAPVAGAPDSSAISREASEPDGSAGISPLLQGLQGWGAPEPGQGDQSATGAVGQTQAANASAPAGQQRPPSQVPLSILQQVLNTEKTAGGMASAGALVSLLSWGISEKESSGQIRPEFQEILHEAISFGKEKKLMPEAQLADYESRLFAEGDKAGGTGKKDEGGCSCSKKGSIKDALQRAHAA